MRAAEHALKFLSRAGVRYLFGIPGGTLNPLYDALLDVPELRHIMARHEAAAAYMATAYARYSGQPGVVLGASGPGASNILTGCASAMRERTPLLVLTGHVRTDRVGLEAGQESSAWSLDMVEAFKPFTKKSVLVTHPGELTRALRLALRLALASPQGPVHLALPLDVQLGEVGALAVPELGEVPSLPGVGTSQLAGLVDFLSGGEGVIFAGSGVKKARATEAFGELVRRVGWPVVTSASGKGVYPEAEALGLGVFGLAGSTAARQAVRNARRLLVLGSSLGESASGSWSPELTAGKHVVHIDSDPTVLGRHYTPHVALVADLPEVLRQLLAVLPPRTAEPPRVERQEEPGPGLVVAHLERLARAVSPETRLCCDIGEHMTWALRHWRTQRAGGFDITVNYGGMGSGIANALGTCLADGRPTVCLTGDGCFAMHGAEVMTALQYRLPVVFVVLNNGGYGMVRWGHQLLFGRAHEDFDYPTPDIAGMARAMGCPAWRVESPEDWAEVLRANPFGGTGPAVIEVRVPRDDEPPMKDRVRTMRGE
jgi:acetolactate synthase-1/2/3 large subunit